MVKSVLLKSSGARWFGSFDRAKLADGGGGIWSEREPGGLLGGSRRGKRINGVVFPPM
jgi:hypothetical protein